LPGGGASPSPVAFPACPACANCHANCSAAPWLVHYSLFAGPVHPRSPGAALVCDGGLATITLIPTHAVLKLLLVSSSCFPTWGVGLGSPFSPGAFALAVLPL